MTKKPEKVWYAVRLHKDSFEKLQRLRDAISARGWAAVGLAETARPTYQTVVEMAVVQMLAVAEKKR